MDELDIWRSATACLKALGDYSTAVFAAGHRAKELREECGLGARGDHLALVLCDGR